MPTLNLKNLPALEGARLTLSAEEADIVRAALLKYADEIGALSRKTYGKRVYRDAQAQRAKVAKDIAMGM